MAVRFEITALYRTIMTIIYPVITITTATRIAEGWGPFKVVGSLLRGGSSRMCASSPWTVSPDLAENHDHHKIFVRNINIC